MSDKYRSKQIIEATQFIFENKNEEMELAKKLGLSQTGHSELWGKNFTNLGWRIVYYGDYIVHNVNGSSTREVPCNKEEFERRYEKTNC